MGFKIEVCNKCGQIRITGVKCNVCSLGAKVKHLEESLSRSHACYNNLLKDYSRLKKLFAESCSLLDEVQIAHKFNTGFFEREDVKSVKHLLGDIDLSAYLDKDKL